MQPALATKLQQTQLQPQLLKLLPRNLSSRLQQLRLQRLKRRYLHNPNELLQLP